VGGTCTIAGATAAGNAVLNGGGPADAHASNGGRFGSFWGRNVISGYPTAAFAERELDVEHPAAADLASIGGRRGE
jgi:hypothetical protein